MKVKELIEQLEKLDENMEVCVSAQYGGWNFAKKAEVKNVVPNPNFKPGDREGELTDFLTPSEKEFKVITIW